MRALVNNYLHPRHRSNFAIMIHGPWGIGKTYYIHEELLSSVVDNNHYSSIYVSVAGMSDPTDIFRLLIAHRIKGINPSKITNVSIGIVDTLIDVGLRSTGLFRSGKNDIRIKGKDLFNFENTVIFVDDLERMVNAGIPNMMGQLHSLVASNRNTKIVYICDEDRIDNDTYRVAKEKYIGWTVPIKVDLEQACTAILKRVTSSQSNILLDDIDFYRDVILELNLTNLRTIEFFVEVVSTILHYFDGLSLITVRSALYSILVMCIEYRKPEFDASKPFPDCMSEDYGIKTSLGFLVHGMNVEDIDKVEGESSYRFNKCRSNDEYDFELVDEDAILLDLVMYKPYVNDEISQYLEDLDKKLLFARKSEDWKLLDNIISISSVLNTSDEKYVATLNELCRRIGDRKLNTHEFLVLRSRLRVLELNDFVPDNVDLSTKYIDEIIDSESPNFEQHYEGQNRQLLHFIDNTNNNIPKEIRDKVHCELRGYMNEEARAYLTPIFYLERNSPINGQDFIAVLNKIDLEDFRQVVRERVIDYNSLNQMLNNFKRGLKWSVQTGYSVRETYEMTEKVINIIREVEGESQGFLRKKLLIYGIRKLNQFNSDLGESLENNGPT